MNISQREKILITVALCLALIAGFYKFSYSPVQQKIKIIKQENTNLEQKNLELKKINSSKDQRSAELQKAIDEYTQLEIKIPPEPQFAEIINLLNQISEQSGVILDSVDYQQGEGFSSKAKSAENDVTKAPGIAANTAKSTPEANQPKTGTVPAAPPKSNPNQENDKNKNNGLTKLNFTISISGNYYQLLTFLLELEKSPRIISVASCSLAATPIETVSSAIAEQQGSEQRIAASGDDDGGNSSSPPTPPQPKINRIQINNVDHSGPGNTVIGKQLAQKARDKYDMNHFQMNLQISTYYIKK